MSIESSSVEAQPSHERQILHKKFTNIGKPIARPAPVLPQPTASVSSGGFRAVASTALNESGLLNPVQ